MDNLIVITLHAKLRGAVYCNRSCLWVCLFVCGSVTTITQNCVYHLHHTGSVGAGSTHLQLIKFWPCAPGKGVCGRVKLFGSALLQPARSVCVSLSAYLIQPCCCSDCWLVIFCQANFTAETRDNVTGKKIFYKKTLCSDNVVLNTIIIILFTKNRW